MTSSRPLTLAALALSTIMTMSACSSQSDDPTGNPTAGSASPTPTNAASSTPTVPADWQTVGLREVAELSVPADWAIKPTTASLQTLEAPKDKSGLIPGWATVGLGNLTGGDEKEAFDWSVERDMKTNYAEYTNLKRLPDEVINGTTFYRLQFESPSHWYDVYGTVTPDAEYSIGVEWKFLKTNGRKQAEAIWSPVMPTFKML